MPEVQKVTEDQAAEALKALVAQTGDEDEAAPAASEPEPAAEEAPAAPAQEEPAEAPAEGEQAPAQETASDDVESLRKRLQDAEAGREAAIKEERDRAIAMRDRFAQNETILRNRFLKKANVTAQALKVLRQSRSESGVPQEEVDRTIREIEATMNPSSPSYAPPEEEVGNVNEDQAIVLNNFLNEKAMSASEAEAFAKWMKTEAATDMSPVDQAVARRDLDGFLRLAHSTFLAGQSEKSKQQKRQDAVGAVRGVQITQRAAARAASAVPSAPKKIPTGPKTTLSPDDYRKFTHDDISTLLKQSVEQYK